VPTRGRILPQQYSRLGTNTYNYCESDVSRSVTPVISSKPLGRDIVPYIDISFPITGKELPADHGYFVLAAVSRLVPSIHGDPTLGIHPIRGHLIGNRRIALNDNSRLVIRAPHERFGEFIELAGQQLHIGSDSIRLGVPEARLLEPAPSLYSRLVVIKGCTEPEPFLQSARRQLDKRGIRGRLGFVERLTDIPPVEGGQGSRSSILRRTLNVQGREIVGFALRVDELEDEESIMLQTHGIGGRRRMGCGIFVPLRWQ
jgi:CRISPR-associated protein Cas6